MIYARTTTLVSFDEADQPAIIVASVTSEPSLLLVQCPDEESRAGKPLKPMTKEERDHMLATSDYVVLKFNTADSVDRMLDFLCDLKMRFFEGLSTVPQPGPDGCAASAPKDED